MRIPVVVLAALVFAAGCKTAEQPAQREASTYSGEGNPKIKFGDGGTGTGQPAPQLNGQGDGGSNVLGWVAAPFENVVYLPWKFVGGGLKGFADGIGAGFSKDRMPVIGVLFTPINAVAGFVTGAFEGLAMSPGLVGPDDNFGYAMGRPMKHATSIWWYE